MVDDNQTDREVMTTMKLQIKQLLQKNEAMQASMTAIQQQQHEQDELHREDVDELDPQPLSMDIWNAPVPENLKSLSLLSFDGKSDPVEHATTFNTQMAVIGALKSLRCNAN